MHAQIIFLGTAGDAFVLSKQDRIGGGFVVQTESAQLHINPGPGAFLAAALAKIQVQKTTAVIVTDNTFIHTHDVPALIEAMTLGTFDAKGLLLAPKSALESDDLKNPPRVQKKYQEAVEKTIMLQEETRVECNEIQIQTIKIKNSDPAAIGLKLITKDFSLGYTGKTKYTAKLKDAFNDVEVMIFELSMLTEEKKEDGLCLEDVKKLIEEIRPQLAVLTGFGISLMKEDILEITRFLYKQTGVQIIAAKEGFSFDPTNYAVKLRQKRLHGF